MSHNVKNRRNRLNMGRNSINRCFSLKRPVFWLLVSFLMLFSACTTSVSRSGITNETQIGITEQHDTGTAPPVINSATVLPSVIPADETEITLTPTPESGTLRTPSIPAPSETSRPIYDPSTWKDLPVIPEIPDHVKQIYFLGIQNGNDPQAFSKIGDCESSTTWYLADFDLGPEFYNLGPYEDLEGVINHFSGSFERLSLAAGRGFTTASVLSSVWADPKLCEPNESVLACEYRLQNPSIALITMGTNDASKIEFFEKNMRQIIEFTLEEGIIPVLATKADNFEGDHEINEIIARLAYEYDIPLWNFWAAVQPLYRHGLQDDQVHITWAANNFGDAAVMQNAWPVRNLTALQMLNAVWTAVSEE